MVANTGANMGACTSAAKKARPSHENDLAKPNRQCDGIERNMCIAAEQHPMVPIEGSSRCPRNAGILSEQHAANTKHTQEHINKTVLWLPRYFQTVLIRSCFYTLIILYYTPMCAAKR